MGGGTGAFAPGNGAGEVKDGEKKQSKATLSNLDLESKLVADSTVTHRTYSPYLRQILAASGPILATVGSGMTSGYSATLLPKLRLENSTIPIDDTQASWIASMAALPMSIGCILAGLLMERVGRRTTLFLVSVPFVAGWVIISAARDLAALLVGRFITGLCVGLLGPASAVYIGETSEPKHRGLLLAAVSLAVAVGLFVAHLLGTFLSWQLTAALCALCPLACYILAYAVPESPSWLVHKGRMEEAEVAFRWLRGHSQHATDEMNAMFRRQLDMQAAQAQQSQTAERESTWRDQLRKPEVWKPLCIMNLYFFTTQFSGVNTVAFYSVTIMKDTVGDDVNEYLAMLIIDTLRVVMSIAACVLTRQYGRRPLTLVSGIGTAASLLALAANSHLAGTHAWFAMSALVGYITFVSIGLVPLPWAMCGEVFPLRARGIVSGVTSGFAFLAFFVVVKTGPELFATIGTGGTFFFYGSIALAGTIILYFFLPETRNKTLQEIEEYFANGTKPVIPDIENEKKSVIPA